MIRVSASNKIASDQGTVRCGLEKSIRAAKDMLANNPDELQLLEAVPPGFPGELIGRWLRDRRRPRKKRIATLRVDVLAMRVLG